MVNGAAGLLFVVVAGSSLVAGGAVLSLVFRLCAAAVYFYLIAHTEYTS